MAVSSTVPVPRTDASPQPALKVGGISALLFGAAVIADLFVFAAYVSSTGVTIPGDNPAAFPDAFAQSLANGAHSAFWTWYVVLAALATFAFAFMQSIADRLRAAGSRLPILSLGTAGLAIYVVMALASAAIEREAGSGVLTRSELVTSIPVLFGVLIPVLLGAFDLLAAACILAISWAGWRYKAMPPWLCVLGGVSALALLAGVTGAAGPEVLVAPWFLAAGIWMLVRLRVAVPSDVPAISPGGVGARRVEFVETSANKEPLV